MISHDLDVAAAYSDRMVLLRVVRWLIPGTLAGVFGGVVWCIAPIDVEASVTNRC